MLTITLPFTTNLCVFHKICSFCALHFGSFWASRIPKISSQWVLLRRLFAPHHNTWASLDLLHDVEMIEAGIFIFFSHQKLTGARMVVKYAKLDKLGYRKTSDSSAYLSPWLFWVGEHSARKQPQPGVTQLPTMACLQVLITEPLIRNQKVNGPPEKVEVRWSKIDWPVRYNTIWNAH